MLENLTTDGLEENSDFLGGFQALESDIYTGTVKMAYLLESAKGAKGISLILDLNGQEYRETVYVTNRSGENFFLNKDKKKVALPGFTIIDDLCLCATNEPLAAQKGEEKQVKVYDPDAKKELPKSMPVLVDLLGKTASFAIQKVVQNRTQKNQQTGDYEPTNEEQTINSIVKVFHTDTKKTVPEIRNNQDSIFWESWEKRNKGVDRVTYKPVGDGNGNAGAPKASSSGESTKQTGSLFN